MIYQQSIALINLLRTSYCSQTNSSINPTETFSTHSAKSFFHYILLFLLFLFIHPNPPYLFYQTQFSSFYHPLFQAFLSTFYSTLSSFPYYSIKLFYPHLFFLLVPSMHHSSEPTHTHVCFETLVTFIFFTNFFNLLSTMFLTPSFSVSFLNFHHKATLFVFKSYCI